MILAFHKPYGVLSQFTKEKSDHRTLAEFKFPKNVYPIGRLDWDSEGLLLLSDEKEWNDKLLNPRHAHERIYHCQVEGMPTKEAIEKLSKGVIIQGRKTKPCKVKIVSDINYPERNPPIRIRKTIPTSWIEIKLTEGKNRQVRRMTANVGFPTLRLIRKSIGKFEINGLPSGKWKELNNQQREFLLL